MSRSVAKVHPERRSEFQAADFAGRLAIHDRVAGVKALVLEVRRDLGRRYLERHEPDVELRWASGLARLDIPCETAAAREEALRLAEGRDAQADNRSLEFTVLGRDFAADSAAVALATSPLLLAPIVRYFGMLPVFFNMFVTRAHTPALLENSSHRFHLDPEDVITQKVFVHLTDVDEDCGPLHVLPADATRRVLDAVDYREIARLPDHQVDALVGWDRVVRCCGAAGTTVIADTSRCLHFGGRPRAAGKPVRQTLVFQYLLPTSYLFPIDGDWEHPRHLPNLEPAGDDEWDALIGARYT